MKELPKKVHVAQVRENSYEMEFGVGAKANYGSEQPPPATSSTMAARASQHALAMEARSYGCRGVVSWDRRVGWGSISIQLSQSALRNLFSESLYLLLLCSVAPFGRWWCCCHFCFSSRSGAEARRRCRRRRYLYNVSFTALALVVLLKLYIVFFSHCLSGGRVRKMRFQDLSAAGFVVSEITSVTEVLYVCYVFFTCHCCFLVDECLFVPLLECYLFERFLWSSSFVLPNFRTPEADRALLHTWVSMLDLEMYFFKTTWKCKLW